MHRNTLYLLKRIILPTLVALALTAAPAQAVSTDYCDYSLRGGGSLAPDNDIYAHWQYLESSRGINITSSYAEAWGRSDNNFVYARWIFWRHNGSAVRNQFFYCSDQRADGFNYNDAYWFSQG